jgi:replicative DNA helicase
MAENAWIYEDVFPAEKTNDNLLQPGPAQISVDHDERLIIAAALSKPGAWLDYRYLRPSDFNNPLLKLVWEGFIRGLFTMEIQHITDLNTADSRIDSAALSLTLKNIRSSPTIAKTAATRLLTKRRLAEATTILKEGSRAFITKMTLPADQTNDEWQTDINLLIEQLFRLTGHTATNDAITNELLAKYDILHASPLIPTGIARLDEFLGGGLTPKTIIAVAGATKVGKTVLAATISHNLENHPSPIPHLIISLQRSRSELAQLKLARRLGIEASQFKNPGQNLRQQIDALPVSPTASYVMHKPGATYKEIAAEIAHQARVNGIRLVIIDYLQLIAGKQPREPDESHMTTVSQALLNLANDLNVAILVLVLENDFGEPWLKAHAIKYTSQAYLVLHRDKSARGAYFETKVSAYLDENDIGTIQHPSIMLMPDGPHFD